MQEPFKIIAFTHKTVSIDELGKLSIPEEDQYSRMNAAKEALDLKEIMLLATCNRTEYLLVNHEDITIEFLTRFFSALHPNASAEFISSACKSAVVFSGDHAVMHLFEVSSSLDSLVVGEREIITQVRNAYDKWNNHNLTGDLIRLVIKHTIETSKRVYSMTQIAARPVSVVSLAYRKLRDLNVKLDARILFVGAGVTNTNMAKYLKKHGFRNFAVFNRTLKNSAVLAEQLNGTAFTLPELNEYQKGFDVLIACTSSTEFIIDKPMFHSLNGNEKDRKILIDLSVPANIDPSLNDLSSVHIISINGLREIADNNLKEREGEVEKCKEILYDSLNQFKKIVKERKVELVMKDLPVKVKEIKSFALNEVFAKDLSKMDESSRDILEKVLDYMEKKYISVPMKMAKEIMLSGEESKHA